MRRNGLELFIILAVAALAMAALRQDTPPPEAESEPLHHYLRGVTLARQGDHQKAITEFSAALALKPDYLKAYRGRGRSWLAEGSRERALADYSNGLAHAQGPLDSWVHSSTVEGLHEDRARLYLVWGRFEECLLDADQTSSYDLMSCARAGVGRWEEAQDYLELQKGYFEHSTAIGFDEVVDWSFLVHLAGVHDKLGHSNEARQALEQWKGHGSPSPHGPEGPCFLCR